MSGTKNPTWTKFVFGGLAGCMATTCVQPIDLVKTRIQLSGELGAEKQYKNAFDAFKKVYKNEGLLAFYNGYSGAILRQIMYTTTRMGAFNTLYGMREASLKSRGKKMNIGDRLLLGMTAGAIGACVGNPAEVVLVRMTADGRLPKEARRNYKHAFDAMFRIVREEGFMMLFKGVDATIFRAMALNGAQLGMYAQSKQILVATGVGAFQKDGMTLYLGSSLVSGFLCSLASLPFDVIKTRVQNAKKGTYAGALDCAKKLITREGVFSLWKGFPTYFFRIAPHTILTFLFLEQINKLYTRSTKKH